MEEIASATSMPAMGWEDRDFVVDRDLLHFERLWEHHEEDMSWEDEDVDD